MESRCNSCCARKVTMNDGTLQAVSTKEMTSQSWVKHVPVLDNLRLALESERKLFSPAQAEDCPLDEGISLGFDRESLDFDKTAGSSLLGNGGFGSVYKAYWKGQHVAVKTCNRVECERDSPDGSRLWQEALICVNLNHANIVQFLGVAETTAGISLVMEYCVGGSLSTVLSKKDEIPLSTLLTWAQQVAEGMSYLHHSLPAGPVVHKDLKSANVLLFRKVDVSDLTTLINNPAKICDFGLASVQSKEDSPAPRSGLCIGTFPYLAPETISRSLFSCASDVWSFGVVLWELLTSEIPYQHISSWSIAHGVSTQQLKLPISDTCPAELRKLIEDCWQMNPSDRPTFPEICDNLADALPAFAPSVDYKFARTQQKWREEIVEVFDELREKEQVLRSREEEISHSEHRQAALRTDIQRRWESLERRENMLHNREVELGMMTTDPQPEPLRRTSSSCSRKGGVLHFFRRLGSRAILHCDSRVLAEDAMSLPLLRHASDDNCSIDDGFESSSSFPPTPTGSSSITDSIFGNL